MKQLEVQIMGQSYVLGAPAGGEERLRQAVQRLDDAMCKIRDAGKVKARERIAVLAALNLAFDLSSSAMSTTSLRTAEAPSDASAGSPASTLAPAEHAALAALMARLDTALGEDGRLI